MNELTVSEARQRFFELVKKAVRDHLPIQITSKSGEAVLISKEDYDSLLETLELFSTRGMLRSISPVFSSIWRIDEKTALDARSCVQSFAPL
ncbi:MAG: hypothetical protein A3G87_01760 [Omnitrophica bacterium RIFCSPLOWO2_12_FULL_50_11]|nr:MAG: hypothetical protein A3G87_01760 [Omnitrophica bacterium RIFCSPLOWO2_12_FULL_50_11]